MQCGHGIISGKHSVQNGGRAEVTLCGGREVTIQELTNRYGGGHSGDVGDSRENGVYGVCTTSSAQLRFFVYKCVCVCVCFHVCIFGARTVL